MSGGPGSGGATGALAWCGQRQVEALKRACLARKLFEKLQPQVQAAGLTNLLNSIEMPLVGGHDGGHLCLWMRMHT